MENIDVSVIVTTKNEEFNISNCLQSVKNQSFPQEKIEIIVVDNNSTDKTVEIAGIFTDKIYNYGPERSEQRNFGIEKSSGKYVLYLDADMMLSQNVIKECFEKCENEGLIALYIPEHIVGKGFWIKVRNFERSFYNATCIDGVRFVNRGAFIETGGFDLSLTGPEDWDIDRRLNQKGKTGIIKSPLFHNEGAFNLKKYLGKKSYYSGNLQTYIDKWGANDPIIRKQVGFYYRFFGVFIENGKWVRLIRHPILTKGMYFLRFLVGIQYLKAKLRKNGQK